MDNLSLSPVRLHQHYVCHDPRLSGELFDGDDPYTAAFRIDARPDCTLVNMGPQHPSTHGVLRVLVELDGEYIRRLRCVLGYVHRMQEFMGQAKMANQFLPNTARIDYLHALAWSWSYVGAVERLAGLTVPRRAEYLRVALTELNRISSHLLWWGAFLLDIGAITPIMYAFEDRERLLDLLQEPTGSRLTYSWFRFGGALSDVSSSFVTRTKAFCKLMRERLPMYHDLVTGNAILRERLQDVGMISPDLIRAYGASGPVARGSGLATDVRRDEPYGVYHELDFAVVTATECDCYARYRVRLAEIEQSLNLVEQALDGLPEGPVLDPKAPKAKWKAPAGTARFAVESARGRVVCTVVSNGKDKLSRVKLRSPSFSNLHMLEELGKGVLLADLVSIMGSLDLVIPEIDR